MTKSANKERLIKSLTGKIFTLSIQSEIATDIILHLLFSANMKRDLIITYFKGADS